MSLTFNPITMGTGADSIDAQHKVLVDLINRLLGAMQTGRAREEVGPILNDLAKYATSHFAHEEACMARFNCPVALANKNAHGAFLNTFTAMKADYDKNGPSPTMAIRMQRELSDWLQQHIVGVDVKLKPCIPPGSKV